MTKVLTVLHLPRVHVRIERMETTRPSANDRKLSNFAIAPNKQFRLAFYTIMVGLFIFLSFFAFELWLLSSLITSLAPLAPEDSNIYPLLADSLRWSWIGFFLVAALFSLVMFLGILVISHRFYGPMVALRRHLGALMKGEYSHRTHLRKNDELKEIAHDLNQLSEYLESKAR